MDDLQHVGRKHLVQHVGVGLAAKGRFLRGLEHDGVAGRQRREHHPMRHRHREIPRCDRGADTERIVVDHGPAPPVFDHLGRECVPDLREVLREAVGERPGFGHGLAQRLAHLARDQLTELTRPLAERSGHAPQQLRSSIVTECLPRGLCGARPSHDARNGLGRRDGYFANDLAGRGIDGRQRRGDIGDGHGRILFEFGVMLKSCSEPVSGATGRGRVVCAGVAYYCAA